MSKLFHGTTSSAVASIWDEGIVPNDMGAVYLTTDRDEAVRYASTRSAVRDWPFPGAVVEVHLPDDADVVVAGHASHRIHWGRVSADHIHDIVEIC